MPNLFWTLFSWIGRALLSLRYRIEVKGIEQLTPEKLNRSQGILFMPNHPAHMDPLINFLFLWPKFRMRPLEVEHIYRLPLLKWVNRWVRAIPIPDFELGVNEYKVKRAEQGIREISEGLKQGDHFIVYPAGRLKSGGKEVVGGASGVHELLMECPGANVVLIRTTGLWGSSFSRALLGRSPDLLPALIHGLKVLCKNLIFFAPRRKILIELEPNPPDMPREGVSRIELNRFLENWYNRYPDEQGNVHEKEPLSLVSYHRLWEDLPEVFPFPERKNLPLEGSVPSEETKEKIYKEIRKIADNPDLEIKPDMHLAFDLGMDSLNIAELIAYVTKNFDIGELHPEELESVGALLQIVQEGRKSRRPKGPLSTFTWPEEKKRPLPALPLGKTLPEAFLNVSERMKGRAACADDLVGVVSYRKMKRAVLGLARYFQTWEEKRVALMLPASAGAYIAILALQFAGKTPVLLNWTLGARYLEEMMKVSGASRIVTSEKFLDRLPNVQFGSCLNSLVFLEGIRQKLTLGMKLRAVFLSFRSVRSIVKKMKIDRLNENDPCAILFTSGTEAAPKGVPLSHRNIISNERAAMQCIEFSEKDVLYGILPPFHSFGFSVAGLFPILAGIQIAFYPDPTDGFALAEGVERWKVTLFCGAPSFIKGLFHAAKPDQLQTIRFFISGAEKAPEELIERVKKLGKGKMLVEGYGITECSPIISMNRPRLPPKGVGRLLSNLELVTIHPETLEPLPLGTDGEICVRGASVFSGYLGSARSPFIEISGKMWYRTGDLGHLDPEGNLILSGRLKRFTKIGGEMISLGAIEEVLVKGLLAQNRISSDIPSLAVCADEKEEGKPRLILFATIRIDKEEANQILHKAGFSNLLKISSVRPIDQIPLMGAGKTDYRTLQGLC